MHPAITIDLIEKMRLNSRIDWLSPPQAAARFPGRPHRNAVHRWMQKGVMVSGHQLWLKAVPLGCELYTTEQWIREFQAESLHARNNPIKTTRRGPSNSVLTDRRAARRVLNREGIY